MGKRLNGVLVPGAEAGGFWGARESKGAAESGEGGAPDVRGPQVAAFPPPSGAVSGLSFVSLFGSSRVSRGVWGERT